MNVVDLYSGVGGLSLGATRAGFNLAGAVEIDKHAIFSHKLNFPESAHLHKDVSKLTAQDILSGCNVKEIDCVVGGPPCQGFSSIGKGNADDTRNELYVHFFRLVSELSPICFLAENVPGIMNEKYNSVREKAFSLVSDRYTLLHPIKVNASNYGAPTTRTRIFFIGFRKDYSNQLKESDFFPKNIIEQTFIKDALYGLPRIIKKEWQEESQGWRKVKMDRKGYFYDRLWGHIPDRVGDAESLKKLEDGLVSGFLGTVHSDEIIKRYGSLSFGETDKISRSQRLDPNGFCPTLRAGTGSDKGSYQAVRPIHPTQARVIAPREAARLQGFPDWFRFHPTKWHSFRQIGNSVSPLVSEAMLLPIYNYCLSVKKELSNTMVLPCSIR
ncbi:DNA cytosine methyltransferase [Klebsiella pneumoniae]|uniref:DNA cytosine methyltransferase n=1 Tax=Klebsiella pneumoniae TaxID=573 RepID=UPI001D0A2591|nr:DNA cytosine methyltransferase [Klebsiella pneumoniae]MCB8436367.1 DNA cytosine methyltransferase [Klebsiella pneumoniae]MCB8466566.1 DNA cytosine methyltransferase [Klebsiella pneumoniae]